MAGYHECVSTVGEICSPTIVVAIFSAEFSLAGTVFHLTVPAIVVCPLRGARETVN
ncbi:hypothetical protein [Micromonospora lupini]|uniref:hypothetical protein n=1 Tax=Micromonospora lupini TaxID=285679 RepID=UPI0031CE9F0E